MSCIFITVSIAIFCATTMPSIRKNKRLGMGRLKELDNIEWICSVFFCLEFLMRLIFCPSKLHFIKGIMNWIDFVAVVPFFLSTITDDPVVRVLVVIRVLRLFRFIKLSYGLQIMVQTLKASSHELILLLLMLLIPVVMFSSIVYYVEVMIKQERSTFTSIPDSFWWCLITMTTVGYGDMTPETWPGKVIGGACAICGVLIVALPISVIGNNFNLYYAHAQARLKLPTKHRRLVLGGVPGLLSKQQELSSRRKKKTKTNQSNVDYELCTSDDMSSTMSSPQHVPRRARSDLNPDHFTESEKDALINVPRDLPLRRRQRGNFENLIAFNPDKDGNDNFKNGEVPSSTVPEERETLLSQGRGSPNKDIDDTDDAFPVLNVTSNPIDEHLDDEDVTILPAISKSVDNSKKPESKDLDKTDKDTSRDSEPSKLNQNDRLYPNSGLRSKRKLSLSDSKLASNHRDEDETPQRYPSDTETNKLSAKFKELQPPRTQSVPGSKSPLNPEKKVLANGSCPSGDPKLNSSGEDDFIPRDRTTTFPYLPDYVNKGRRKGLSVAPSTSKDDPEFLETKI